jgi:hydroxymethylglutaryl-CoA lyase
MCEAMGLRTGIDLDKLVQVRDIVRAGLPAEEPLHGALARAGVPKGYVPAGGFAQAAE